MDHYPTEKELDTIVYWDFNKKPVTELLEYVKTLWHWSDRYMLSGKKVLTLYLSTGGWSGNESIINALERNFVFWMICWTQSRRGGHYYFKIPLKAFKRKQNGKRN